MPQLFAINLGGGGGGDGGVLTIGNFGSSPNAAGGTITGTVLTLQPASGTQPGGVSTTTQSFAGAKTFNDSVFINYSAGAALRLGVAGTSGSGVHVVDIVSTVGADGTRALYFQGNASGSDSNGRDLSRFVLNSGYTGAARASALQAIVLTSGTGTNAGQWNLAGTFSAAGGGTWNVSVYGDTDTGNGTTNNIGVRGRATSSTTSSMNAGVIGLGATNASGNNVGVYGMVDSNANIATAVPNASGAGVFNNGASTKDILVAQDNSTKCFAIIDGGLIQTNQAVADAGPPVTVNSKLPIYNTSGTLLGYVAIYDDF